jgi:ribosome-associated toxin RatA of RatAB toxin-antitoxin module
MNKSNKIIILFYIGLAISLISAYSYLDSLYESPQIDLRLPTEPLKKISFANIVKTITHEQMYNVLTDVKNYPQVLPKNVLSVEILNTTDSSIIVIEELHELFLTTKLTVEHSFVPMEKHTIKILDGDAKGTIITQYFKKLPDGLQIITDVDLNLKGILSPLGFLPKSGLDHAMNTVIDEFVIYAETKYTLSENENIVDLLYREILLRPVDIDGLKFYVEMLEDEKMTIDDVRQSLIDSEEHQNLVILKEFDEIDSIKPETKKVINKIYLEILKRSADDGGMLYYSAMFESGKLSMEDIRSELLQSEERSQIDSSNENK